MSNGWIRFDIPLADSSAADSFGVTNQSQLMLFAGFLMLGWVLARRTIAARKRNRKENREADRELKRIREAKEPLLPLADAPPEIQRWQAAMFDLHRELTADLDTRIAVAKNLVDRIDQAQSVAEANAESSVSMRSTQGRIDQTPINSPLAGDPLRAEVASRLERGESPESIASATRVPIGEIRWTIATLHPNAKVPAITPTRA